MAKITICDVCKSKDKFTETKTYFRVKGRADLRLDYCKNCLKDIPKPMKEYTKFVYGLKGITLSDEEVKKMRTNR